MAKHHPMDRLHEHLDRAAGHAAQVNAQAAEAAAAHDAQLAAERRNAVNGDLTAGGE